MLIRNLALSRVPIRRVEGGPRAQRDWVLPESVQTVIDVGLADPNVVCNYLNSFNPADEDVLANCSLPIGGWWNVSAFLSFDQSVAQWGSSRIDLDLLGSHVVGSTLLSVTYDPVGPMNFSQSFGPFLIQFTDDPSQSVVRWRQRLDAIPALRMNTSVYASFVRPTLA